MAEASVTGYNIANTQHDLVIHDTGVRDQGQQGHPVGLGVQCGPALLRLSMRCLRRRHGCLKMLPFDVCQSSARISR